MSMHDIDGIKRESKAERARKEQARRQATQEARSWRRLTAQKQERRFGSEEDAGFDTHGDRVVVEEEGAHAGAGEDRSKKQIRVLTQAGGMHRANKITSEEWHNVPKCCGSGSFSSWATPREYHPIG